MTGLINFFEKLQPPDRSTHHYSHIKPMQSQQIAIWQGVFLSLKAAAHVAVDLQCWSFIKCNTIKQCFNALATLACPTSYSMTHCRCVNDCGWGPLLQWWHQGQHIIYPMQGWRKQSGCSGFGRTSLAGPSPDCFYHVGEAYSESNTYCYIL